MNHLRRILAALLLAALLCGTALADSAFDASLDITENADGSITVTVVDSEANNSILAEHQPTLTVACSFTYAKVTGPDGTEKYYTGTGTELSFTVYIGGAYLIESVSSLPGSGGIPSGGSPAGGGTPAEEPEDESLIDTFTDLNETSAHYNGIEYCLKNGILTGYTDNTFRPNIGTTRGMIVAMLWRMEGKPVVNYLMDFSDVAEGKYYSEAVRWAASCGIVDGYTDNTFRPNQTISRQQMAAILWRYCKYKGIDVSVGEDTNILSYTDAFDISEYAIEAMQWACGASVIQGKTAERLAPLDSATRAQVATIMMRFCTEVAA